jgi:hypothetical protein
MGGVCSTHGGIRNVYRSFIGKREREIENMDIYGRIILI